MNVEIFNTNDKEEDKDHLPKEEVESRVESDKIPEIIKVKEERIMFDLEKNDCDAIILTEDKKLHVKSAFLQYVFTDRFSDIVKTANDGDSIDIIGNDDVEVQTITKYEIDLVGENVDEKNIDFALSFYHPLHLNPFKGEIAETTDFNGLFQLCKRWYLHKLISHLEDYLCTKHPNRPSTNSWYFIGTLSKPQSNLLLWADKFDLENLYREIMTQTPRIDLGSMKENQNFQNLGLLSRYELIRNSVIQLFQSPILSEVEDIFNFYDVLLYEKRTADMSAAKKPFTDSPPFQYDPKEKDDFLAEPKDTRYVMIIVEGVKLFVDSFILVDNSAVFKEMLETAPRDDSGKKVLAMPGKDVNQVVHFMSFLTKPREIEAKNTDLMSLANLAGEFEVPLLKTKMEVFLETVKEENPQVQLKYLKLVKMMKFSSTTLFHLFAQIGKGFTKFGAYQKIKEFTLLDEITKKYVAQIRLWFLIQKSFDTLLDNIQDEMNVILGIGLCRRNKEND